MKPSRQTVEALKGAKSEIVAGGVLFAKNDVERSWNDANARAARILDSYIKGEGLFQVATEVPATTKAETAQ